MPGLQVMRVDNEVVEITQISRVLGEHYAVDSQQVNFGILYQMDTWPSTDCFHTGASWCSCVSRVMLLTLSANKNKCL